MAKIFKRVYRKTSRTLQIVTFNLRVLFQFELIYKLITALLFIPVFNQLMFFVMKLTGYTYITKDNFHKFVASKEFILITAIILIIWVIYTLIDISAVIYIYDMSAKREKTKLLPAIKFGLMNTARCFKPGNIFMILPVLCMVPVFNFGAVYTFYNAFSLGETILFYFNIRWYQYVIAGLVVVAAIVLTMRWLYIFHCNIVEGNNFFKASRRSGNLSKRSNVVDFLKILILQAIIICLFLGMLGLAIGVLILLNKLLGSYIITLSIIASILIIFSVVVVIMLFCLSVPIGFGAVSAMYYDHIYFGKEEDKHIETINVNVNENLKKKLKLLYFVVVIVSVAGCFYYVHGVYNGKYSLRVEHIRKIGVTAHRGASASYPENTMAAFRGAYEEGAKWIELDVQQSKDGYIFVMHDDNFERTTGYDEDVWNMNMEDIKLLDAGYYMGKEFEGERIPTLEEVIQFAKENDIKLNIELKPTGHETDFEKDVVELIEEYNFEKKCVLTSQKYSTLKEIKKENKKIKTVYVMSIAIGDMKRFEYADAFSVKYYFMNETLVSKVHNSGKDIYVWTVNTENSAYDMIDLGVDNIITDDVNMVQDCIKESKSGNVISEIVELIAGYLL